MSPKSNGAQLQLSPCCSSKTNKSGKDVAEQQQEPTTNPFGSFLAALGRKKPLDCRTDTNLNRCLNLLDLTTLGVGSTLGLGLYVLAGQVASNKAGPAVVISFGLAALASAFSALCYAEFAGRVPKAGSAYAYSYITVGEFVAFIIGWNLILEYVIGASSVARGFSGYLRFVCEHIMHSFSIASGSSSFNHLEAAQPLTGHLKLNIANSSANLVVNETQASLSPGARILQNLTHPSGSLLLNASESLLAGASSGQVLASSAAGEHANGAVQALLDYVVRYFDWPSIAIVLVLTGFILFGVKESTNVTLAFTAVNMIVVVTVVFSSLGSLDLHNWQLTKEELPVGDNYGEGGFMPYGWSGVLAGSATCFFGFIGFDTIASSAEEAKSPKRNVPLSITLSLFISFVAYMAIAIVQTLLWPYYDQDKITILPYIFAKLNMPITYWIVLLGAIAGLASSQLGGMYPLPRILYSMAQDKLIYAQLAHVNRRLKLPVRATIVGAIFIALLACLLDIQDLADMVSIGTLAAYSLVSISVLIVRYETGKDEVDDSSLLTSRLCFTDILAVSGGQQKCTNPAGAINLNESQEIAGDSKTNKRQPPRLLDLLISWNSADDSENNAPNETTCHHSKILIGLIVVLTIMLDVVALGLTSTELKRTGGSQLVDTNPSDRYQYLNLRLLFITSGCTILLSLFAVLLMLSRLPTSRPSHPDMFLVPFVPIIPTMSILVNTFLMLNLSYLTWIRFSVWMSVGFFIYFTYGIWNSEGYLLRIIDSANDHHQEHKAHERPS